MGKMGDSGTATAATTAAYINYEKTPFSAVVKVQDFLAMLGSALAMHNEMALLVDSEGMHIRGYDPSHIALVQADYPPNAMTMFDAPENPVVIGLDLKQTIKVFQRMNFGTEVGVTFENNKIILERFKAGRGGSSNTFKIMTHPDIRLDENAVKKISIVPTMQFEIHRNILASIYADIAAVFDKEGGGTLTVTMPDSEHVTYLAEHTYANPQFKKRVHSSEVVIELDSSNAVILQAADPKEHATYVLEDLVKMLEGMHAKSISPTIKHDKDEPEDPYAVAYLDTVNISCSPEKPMRIWYYSSNDKDASPDERLVVSHYLAGRINQNVK